MEVLTEENMVEAKTAPTAASRSFTPLVRESSFLCKDSLLPQKSDGKSETLVRNFLVTATHSTFSKALPYKWKADCSTNGRCTVEVSLSSWLRSQEGTAIQMGGRTAVQSGGVLQYFLRDQ